MIKSISKLIDINADWNLGTLTDVVAVNEGLELWRPDIYGSFDSNLNLLKKDDTTISPEIGVVATLRPNEGKFSGAVAVEESTTNLFTKYNNGAFNGSIGATCEPDRLGFGVNVDSYTSVYEDGYNGTGVKATLTTNANGQAYLEYNNIKVNASEGEYWILQFKVKELSDNIYYYGGLQSYNTGVYISSFGTHITKELGDGWVLHTYSGQTPLNTTDVQANIRIGVQSSNTTISYIVDEAQLEQKSFATSFVEGSRAGGILEYDINIINSSSGFFRYHSSLTGSVANNRIMFQFLSSTGDYLDFETYSGQPFIDSVINGIALSHIHHAWSPQKDTWYNIYWELDGDNFRIKVYEDNGTLIETWEINNINISEFSADTLKFSYFNGGAFYDEVIVLDNILTDNEIQKIINQQLPLERMSTGNRLSPTIDLSTIGSVSSSAISWAETLNGETIAIETSVDSGLTWQTAINGSSIPNLISTDTTLDVRQTLSTTDTTITPRLLDLYWEVISSDTDISNLNSRITTVRNSPIFKVGGLTTLEGNIYWESRSSPIFKEGIDSIIKVTFLPAKWWKAIEIINQWQTKAKPTNDWQSETKPSNIWETEGKPANNWQSEAKPSNMWKE